MCWGFGGLSGGEDSWILVGSLKGRLVGCWWALSWGGVLDIGGLSDGVDSWILVGSLKGRRVGCWWALWWGGFLDIGGLSGGVACWILVGSLKGWLVGYWWALWWGGFLGARLQIRVDYRATPLDRGPLSRVPTRLNGHVPSPYKGSGTVTGCSGVRCVGGFGRGLGVGTGLALRAVLRQ